MKATVRYPEPRQPSISELEKERARMGTVAGILWTVSGLIARRKRNALRDLVDR